MFLGAIFISRKDVGVGGWSRKWQFSLTLCSENVLTYYVGGWVVQESLKTPLRIIKMAPSLSSCIYVESFFFDVEG